MVQIIRTKIIITCIYVTFFTLKTFLYIVYYKKTEILLEIQKKDNVCNSDSSGVDMCNTDSNEPVV